MIFQQFLNEDSGCLSYLVGCTESGEALVVDPGRDRVRDYIALAKRKGLRIARIVDTHTHADHISGNRDLAALTSAKILVHRAAGAVFDHSPVQDGDDIVLGTVDVKVLHTPGHTPDSICLLVTDRSRGELPWFVLTGDTMFVGALGRPDFGGARAAEDMWDSLHRSLLTLDDSVEVYPAHGAGSLCGKSMSSKTGSTIGFERRFNPLLRAGSRGEFVETLMTGIPPKPPSFSTIVAKNRGLLPLASAKPRPYTAREAWEAARGGAVILDIREPRAFGEAHPPGAVNVWIESSQFGDRVASFVAAGTPILVVTPSPSDLERAVAALARIGVDEVVGYVQWGMADWRSEDLPVEDVPQITVHDLSAWIAERPELVVIDVRETPEWVDGHIDGALHIPMGEALGRVDEVPPDRPKAVVCAGGLRSSTVISGLKRTGLGDWYNVTGGMTAWRKSGYPIVTGP
jgi:glyoxylase-like metal-dependent hydrolase (beta-lactamase superfamily II)/rhodanese-related sulfurtransferase